MQGATWDYALTPTANRFYTEGKYYVTQINEADPNSNPSWRTELSIGETFAYDTPYRFDWTFRVDEAWSTEALSTMLVWQMINVDQQSWANPPVQLMVMNGNFVLRYIENDGTPPTGISHDLCSFAVEQREYKISIRVQLHLTNGNIEVWLDNVLIGSAYNTPIGLTTGNDIVVKYGIYRWQPLTGSLSIGHTKMRTSSFEFQG